MLFRACIESRVIFSLRELIGPVTYLDTNSHSGAITFGGTLDTNIGYKRTKNYILNKYTMTLSPATSQAQFVDDFGWSDDIDGKLCATSCNEWLVFWLAILYQVVALLCVLVVSFY